MTLLANIDGISTLIGAVTALLTGLGGIWLKGKLAARKSSNDQVDNAIKLTDAMTAVIETLEQQIERAAEAIKNCEIRHKEMETEILKLRKEVHDKTVENHALEQQVRDIQNG